MPLRTMGSITLRDGARRLGQRRGDDLLLRLADEAEGALGERVVIATGSSNAEHPNVTWSGDGFVVAYSDDVAGAGLDDVYVRVVPCR